LKDDPFYFYQIGTARIDEVIAGELPNGTMTVATVEDCSQVLAAGQSGTIAGRIRTLPDNSVVLVLEQETGVQSVERQKKFGLGK
jgi:hypothetical protein